MKENKIVVRLDDESMKMWLEICSIFKGNTRSSVFRKIIKRIHQASNDALKLNNNE